MVLSIQSSTHSKSDIVEQGASLVAMGTMAPLLVQAGKERAVDAFHLVGRAFKPAQPLAQLFVQRFVQGRGALPGWAMFGMGATAVLTAKAAGRLWDGLQRPNASVDYLRDGTVVTGFLLSGLWMFSRRFNADLHWRLILGAASMALNLVEVGRVVHDWKFSGENRISGGAALFQIGMIAMLGLDRNTRQEWNVMWRNRPAARMAQIAEVRGRIAGPDYIRSITATLDDELAALRTRLATVKGKKGKDEATLRKAIAAKMAERETAIVRAHEIVPDPDHVGDKILRSDKTLARIFIPWLGREGQVALVRRDHAPVWLGAREMPEGWGVALGWHGSASSRSSKQAFGANGMFTLHHDNNVMFLATNNPFHGYGSFDGRHLVSANRFFDEQHLMIDQLRTRFPGARIGGNGRSTGANVAIVMAHESTHLAGAIAMSPYPIAWSWTSNVKFLWWSLIGRSSINWRGLAWATRIENSARMRQALSARTDARSPLEIVYGRMDREYPVGGPERVWPKFAGGKANVRVTGIDGAGHDVLSADYSPPEAVAAGKDLYRRTLGRMFPPTPTIQLGRLRAREVDLHSQAKALEGLKKRLAAMVDHNNPNVEGLRTQISGAEAAEVELGRVRAEMTRLEAMLTPASVATSRVTATESPSRGGSRPVAVAAAGQPS